MKKVFLLAVLAFECAGCHRETALHSQLVAAAKELPTAMQEAQDAHFATRYIQLMVQPRVFDRDNAAVLYLEAAQKLEGLVNSGDLPKNWMSLWPRKSTPVDQKSELVIQRAILQICAPIFEAVTLADKTKYADFSALIQKYGGISGLDLSALSELVKLQMIRMWLAIHDDDMPKVREILGTVARISSGINAIGGDLSPQVSFSIGRGAFRTISLSLSCCREPKQLAQIALANLNSFPSGVDVQRAIQSQMVEDLGVWHPRPSEGGENSSIKEPYLKEIMFEEGNDSKLVADAMRAECIRYFMALSSRVKSEPALEGKIKAIRSFRFEKNLFDYFGRERLDFFAYVLESFHSYEIERAAFAWGLEILLKYDKAFPKSLPPRSAALRYEATQQGFKIYARYDLPRRNHLKPQGFEYVLRRDER